MLGYVDSMYPRQYSFIFMLSHVNSSFNGNQSYIGVSGKKSPHNKFLIPTLH